MEAGQLGSRCTGRLGNRRLVGWWGGGQVAVKLGGSEWGKREGGKLAGWGLGVWEWEAGEL